MTHDAPANQPPLISVVVPTYNERENLAVLVTAVLQAVGATPVELIVVDDASPDGTAQVAAEQASLDPRVRLVERSGKRGLASAVFDGAAEARGEWVCVMDADLSHDPEEIPSMLAKAEEGYDLVIGSRYVEGAAIVGKSVARQIAGYLLNLVARLTLQIRTRDVLTGFALCRRDLLTATPTHYSAGGFKWLLEVLATQRSVRVYEWPIVFRERERGISKAGLGEVGSFAMLCGQLFAWRVKGLLASR